MAGSKDVVANYDKFKEKYGIKGIVCALVIVALIIGGIIWYRNKGYMGYRVLDSHSSGANASMMFANYNGMILRYSSDGISCMNERFEAQWSEGYSMQQPKVDICGDYAAVGDPGGEEVFLFNSKGLVKKIAVTYVLEDFKVSAKGGVFAVLSDSDKKYFRYYDSEGELIAEGKVELKRTGYPLSFDLSEDGRLLIMSYLYVNNGAMKTNVVFYNFDSAGEDALDRIVATYEYKDELIPDVRFFGNDEAAAVGTGAAYIYEGRDKPALRKTVEYPGTPKSLFFGDDRIGMVFAMEGEEQTDKVEVYKASGSKLSAFNMEMSYDHILFSGDNILAYNEGECRLISLSGSVRFSNTFEERVAHIMPVNGKERFVLVTNESAAVINLN